MMAAAPLLAQRDGRSHTSSGGINFEEATHVLFLPISTCVLAHTPHRNGSTIYFFITRLYSEPVCVERKERVRMREDCEGSEAGDSNDTL